MQYIYMDNTNRFVFKQSINIWNKMKNTSLLISNTDNERYTSHLLFQGLRTKASTQLKSDSQTGLVLHKNILPLLDICYLHFNMYHSIQG